jgi:hypothetical protein
MMVAVVAFSCCRSADVSPSLSGRKLDEKTIAVRQKYFGSENVAPDGTVRHDRVILSWTGVSSFAAAFNGHVMLLDGWIARGNSCFPSGVPCPTIWNHSMAYVGSTDRELADLAPTAFFFGHSHFDHAGDLPTVVRANPDIRLFGTAEHCHDIKAEVPAAYCVGVFPTSAAIGAVADLPARTVPGVSITAVKQPHSGPGGDDSPFTWQRACQQFADYPVDPNEPMSWAGPNSGYIAIAWQFRVGHFAVTWQDTAGPIRAAPGSYKAASGQHYDGAQITAALEKLPRTDVRLGAVVVSSRSVMIDHLRALHFPKVFIPLHGDPCFAESRADIQQYIEDQLTHSERPRVRFLSDPADYIKPVVFDPAAPEWRD